VAALRAFYDAAPGLNPPTVRHESWREVGAHLAKVYEEILAPRGDRD
jgi:hypothetical protein